jgi:hypothetical protein
MYLWHENIEEVEQRIAETQNKSIRKLSQETNLSFGTAQLLLKKICTFVPIVCVVHEIKPIRAPQHNLSD